MNWITNDKLIPETDWQEHILALQNQTVPAVQQEVQNALVNAIQTRIPKQPFGIFFSGGVDSTLIALICKQANANFTCYAVGLAESPDLIWARKAAQAIGLTLKTHEISMNNAEELFKKAAAILPNPDVLSIGVGAVIIAAAELAAQDGIRIFFGGLGSEEIFCGYDRHLKATDKTAECWRGLNGMWKRDLIRDHALAKGLGISVLTPFLDDNLIIAAMGIPADDKISTEHKKIILRRITKELGMPHDLAWRKKQAAQYGSKMDNALERLARNAKTSKPEYVTKLQ